MPLRPSEPATKKEMLRQRRRRRCRLDGGSTAIALSVLLFCARCSSAAVDSSTRTTGMTTSIPAGVRKPIPLIRSVEGATTLELAPEGVAFLRSLSKIPVAPVVVMGPYRSGKSFLLNQLLGVGCEEGFGVGHTRDTQTKGVWIWGSPEEATTTSGSGRDGDGNQQQQKHALLFLDSEGFESTGKSDAYDDRIFALGATLASLLVYNLPEALRESDVEKLSFATQLAGSLFSSSSSSSNNKNSLEPGSMLWLIQRDFLGGASPQAALDAALSKVKNPGHDAGISAVNKVRSSLRRIAPRSTAFGLPQPHLDRTKLCELGDEALAPAYREKRAELRELVRKLAKPKRMTEKMMKSSSTSSSSTSTTTFIDGPALADLAERIVGALNARAIPSAGSILEHFNKDLTRTVVEAYSARMSKLNYPVPEMELEAEHEAASAEAVAAFESGRFGGVGGGGDEEEEEGRGEEEEGDNGKVDVLRAGLIEELSTAAAAARDRNELASSRACSAAAERCEDALDAEQRSRLPSERRFEQRLEESCSAKALAVAFKKSPTSSSSATYSSSCVGPAAAAALARADRAVARERVRFKDSYNDRILSGLLVGALAVVAAGRFVLRSTLVEVVGWGCFAFLQLYPKSFLVSGSSMYEASWWIKITAAWEVLVRYPTADAFFLALLVFLGVRRSLRRCRDSRSRRRKEKARGKGGKGRSSKGGRRKNLDDSDFSSASSSDDGNNGKSSKRKPQQQKQQQQQQQRGRLAALVLGGGYRRDKASAANATYRGGDV